MGVESTLLPTDHAAHMNGIETSQAVKCDSTVVEEVGKSVSEEVLQISLENKEDVEFLGTICDHENNKRCVAQAITPPEGNKLEMSTSSEVADETLSSGCQTPRESIFHPFAPGLEEEDGFLQGIRKMFLDLIISNQALEATGKDLIDASPHESCKTPVSKPLLTGIADTCPDAPLRPSLRVLKAQPNHLSKA